MDAAEGFGGELLHAVGAPGLVEGDDAEAGAEFELGLVEAGGEDAGVGLGEVDAGVEAADVFFLGEQADGGVEQDVVEGAA